MLDVMALLHEGQVTAAAARLSELHAPPAARTRGDVMHPGWDEVRIGRLAAFTACLAGDLDPTVAGTRLLGTGAPDLAAMPLGALTASLAGQDDHARMLAARALVNAEVAPVAVDLVPAALALVWSGTDGEARRADALLARLAQEAAWWLVDVARGLAAVEIARREDRWRQVHRGLSQVAQRLDEVADAGATEHLLLDHQRGRVATGVGRRPALTSREAEVLRALTRTASRRDIATELFVSMNTVKSHLRAVYRKLGVASREQALRRADELGLLDHDHAPEDGR
jgi:ATP/maltotriose-dependent transcriptional regulator MalT